MRTINSFPISTKALSEAPEISALGSEVIAHAGNNGVHVNAQWKSANEQRLANIERALNHVAFEFEKQSGTGSTVAFTNPHIVQTRPQILGGKSEVVSGSLVNADVSAVDSLKSDNTTLDSISIPSSLRTAYPLRSAGSVRDEYDFERMVHIQRVGSVDLGSLNWYYGSSRFSWNKTESINLKPSGQGIVANYSVNALDYRDMPDKSLTTNSSGWTTSGVEFMLVRDSSYTDAAAFKTAMSGVYLNYELATPVEHDISSYFVGKPILSAQGGGSLKFTQSQTPALAVPYEIENAIYLLEYDSWNGGSY